MFNLLKSRDVKRSAVILSQGYVQTNIYGWSVDSRCQYLCDQAKTIDNKVGFQTNLEHTLAKIIPIPREGEGGMKINTGNRSYNFSFQ